MGSAEEEASYWKALAMTYKQRAEAENVKPNWRQAATVESRNRDLLSENAALTCRGKARGLSCSLLKAAGRSQPWRMIWLRPEPLTISCRIPAGAGEANDDSERAKGATIRSREDFEQHLNPAIERNAVLESERMRSRPPGIRSAAEGEARGWRQALAVQRRGQRPARPCPALCS